MPSIEPWNELPGGRWIDVGECDGDVHLEIEDGRDRVTAFLPPAKARRVAEELLKYADNIEGKSDD